MKIRDLEMRHELARDEMAAVRGGHDDEVCICLPPQHPYPSVPSPALPDLSGVERSLEQLRESLGGMYPGSPDAPVHAY